MYTDVLNLDVETRSKTDLKKCGLYKYIADPSFRILIFCYSLNGAPVQTVDIAKGEKIPQLIVDLILQRIPGRKCQCKAFNAMFERLTISKHLGIDPMSAEHWYCTMIKCAMLGLPMSLEHAAIALKTDTQKATIGKSLMRKFSIQRKPTKKNPSIWSEPDDLPEEWEQYKEYCEVDVYTEMAIDKATDFFVVPEMERRLYVLDQKINDRGILADKKLIENAIQHSKVYTEKLINEAIAISGLRNPKSVPQLKAWLQLEIDEEITTLKANAVIELIKHCESDKVRRVLEIRQSISKSSVKKFDAMLRMIGEDGRIRGAFQFYGALRTGRWAGRNAQLHNLPKNSLVDLDFLRQLEYAADYDNIDMMYQTSFALSELIRTALIAPKGKLLGMSDFSAIEARVLAWLAVEMWKLEIFKGDGKIYETTAVNMFHVDRSLVTKQSTYRQRAKICELLCIAENEKVLTDAGLVPIQQITSEHKIWDGENFVSHDGVIFKGYKNVITYDGLTATKNHFVWVDGKTRPIQFGIAAACGFRLTKSANGGQAIWVGKNNKPGKTMARGLERPDGLNTVYKLQRNSMDRLLQSGTQCIQRMPAMFATAKNTNVVNDTLKCGNAAVHKSKRQRISELRRTRNRISIRFSFRSRTIFNRYFWFTRSETRDGSKGKFRALRKRKYSFCTAHNQSTQQTNNRFKRVESGRLALFLCSSRSQIKYRTNTGSNIRRCEKSSKSEMQKLAGHTKKVRVFDILNCGPNNRFTVSNCLVHNCGFQGNYKAILRDPKNRVMGTDKEIKYFVKLWREANPRIVQFWKDVNACSIAAVKTGQVITLRNLKFFVSNGIFHIQLPSGRWLSYLRPEVKNELIKFPAEYDDDGTLIKDAYEKWVDVLYYSGIDEKTRQWIRIALYGGLLTENIVQATSRDLLAEKMLAIDAAGFDICIHVHDEVVPEIDETHAEDQAKQLDKIMTTPLSWTAGLPLAADTYYKPYYCKE